MILSCNFAFVLDFHGADKDTPFEGRRMGGFFLPPFDACVIRFVFP